MSVEGAVDMVWSVVVDAAVVALALRWLPGGRTAQFTPDGIDDSVRRCSSSRPPRS